jgi:hypothetical protein
MCLARLVGEHRRKLFPVYLGQGGHLLAQVTDHTAATNSMSLHASTRIGNEISDTLQRGERLIK